MKNYEELNWVNDETELSAENFNHMEDGIAKASNIELIAVSEEAPSDYQLGDKYYNITDDLIYTCVPTGWDTGEDPLVGPFYVVLKDQSSYYYDGKKMVSVGGGTEDILIQEEEPETDDWKIWIDKKAVDNLGSEVYVGNEEPENKRKVWFKQGKNLFDKNNKQIIENNGYYHMGGTRRSNSDYTYLTIPVKGGKAITYSGANNCNPSTGSVFVVEQYNNEEMITEIYPTKQSDSIVLDNNCNKIYVSFPKVDKDTIQIEYGENATSYEPYMDNKIQTLNSNGEYEVMVETAYLDKLKNMYWQTMEKTTGKEQQMDLIINCKSNYQEFFIFGQKGLYGSFNCMNGATIQGSLQKSTGTFNLYPSGNKAIRLNMPENTRITLISHDDFTISY